MMLMMMVTDPPLGSTYDGMKRVVLLRMSLYVEKRFQTLINEEQLGNRTPIQLLQSMRELAEDVPVDSAHYAAFFYFIYLFFFEAAAKCSGDFGSYG